MNLITILCLDFLGLSFFIRVYDKELIAEPNSYMTLRQLWFSIWSILNITFARFYRLSFIFTLCSCGSCLPFYTQNIHHFCLYPRNIGTPKINTSYLMSDYTRYMHNPFSHYPQFISFRYVLTLCLKITK